MNSYCPKALSKAVAAICPDIQSNVSGQLVSDERHKWWELSCCILSSQVPYSLAVAAADAIDREKLFYGNQTKHELVLSRLIEILSNPLVVEGKKRSYRFPIARANQLAKTYSTVLYHGASLTGLLNSFSNEIEARNWLVSNISGIGPKQASMFLRNIGVSFDLAILDRHVLSYMFSQGINSEKVTSISTLSKYTQFEAILQEHAEELDCPVGVLDWAIWIVMRVANQNQEVVLA
jgi:N-glycosylase/DNA lyase